MFPVHPAEREAERLRVIIQTLAHSNPDMTMDEAGPIIFRIEEETAKLEARQVEAEASPKFFELPNTRPETIASYIDLRPDIQAEIPTRKINAIKDVRASCTSGGLSIGLKDAKDGVEYWADSRGPGAPTPLAPRPGAPGSAAHVKGITRADAVEWVNVTKSIMDEYDFKGKIHAIKECRALTTFGLKEAKELIEDWAIKYR